MSERKPVAYSGSSPYIFVSYSHKDSAVVYPFILALQEICNVWFDEGIHYGNEWEDEIAAKLEGCRIFIYMITPNSLASSNCKDEIAFAREMDKNFINVMVNSETELSKAFRLRYGRYQMCKLDSFGTVEMAVADLARKCKWMEEVAKDGGTVAQEDKPAAPATRTEPRGRIEPPFDMSGIGSFRRVESDPVSRKSRTIASFGRISAPSPAETAKECRELANSGDANAQYRLGTMYANGLGVSFNNEEAQKWYRKAAAQGHADARKALEHMARRDAEIPFRLPPVVLANRQREEPGDYFLGEDYFPERVAGPGPAETAKQCRALANSGDADAQYRLGTMFENGRGVRFNDEEARKWYRKAAAQGHSDARKALERMARRNAEPPPRAAPVVPANRHREEPEDDFIEEDYFPERDAEPSPAEMAKQCRALALEGDAEAQYLLGTMYENGLGVRFNDEEAKKWYRKAAAQGYAEARRALRRMG